MSGLKDLLLSQYRNMGKGYIAHTPRDLRNCPRNVIINNSKLQCLLNDMK